MVDTSRMDSICISDTLRALSDDKSLTLFNMVAFALSRDAGVVMTRLGIRRKQYYSRMNRLIDAGLVMRKNGKFFLTSFGKVVYESHVLIGEALEHCWKLKAIDSTEASLPAEERRRIIDSLIEKKNIKNILLNHNLSLNQNNKFSDKPVLSAIPTSHQVTVIDK